MLLLVFSFMLVANSAFSSYSLQATAGSQISDSSELQCPPPGPADFSTQAMTASGSNASVPGHVVQPVKQGLAQFLRYMPSSLQLTVQLVFKIRNAAQFQSCLAAINDPSSPEYGRFLNSTTLQPFLPTPGQEASLSQLLTREGLVVADGASPLVLNVKGSARAMMSAFGIRLGLYSYHNGIFFAADSDPQMPNNFASLVIGIRGLDNYTVIRPAESPCSGPYCPQGIEVGYSVSSLYSSGYTGSGQTVAIVDAPGDPNSQTAINTFDTQYGLPATTLDIIYPDGAVTSWDPGWASEAAMDMEAVHSVATGASILLAYDTGDPMNSVDYIASNGLAKIISNSWVYTCSTGLCSDTELPSSMVSSVDSRLAVDAAQGVTILFASGDWGAKPDGSTLGTVFPASDPNVLAVGATNLVLTGCGTTTCSGYGSETGASISGGGYSGYFAEPSWQTSTIGTKSGRGVPDVSMVGYSPNFWVYSTASNLCGTSSSTSAGWFGCAGTSLSTPLWAGFLGVALQVKGGGGFGIINPLLYQAADGSSYSTIFHDVTSGSNNGYSAGGGWDPVTGWGTPIANNLATAFSSGGATTTTSTTLLATVSSTTTTTSFTSTTSGSQISTSSSTSTVSAPASITNTLTTTTTTTGSLASTSTTTFTSPLSTSYSTSGPETSSTTTSYTQTGTTTTGTLTDTTTSTSTSFSTTTSSGTATITQTQTFNVLLTQILQGLKQFEALILQTLGFQVTATPIGQQVHRIVVTVRNAGQVTMTVSYSVSGGGSPTAPAFNYVQNGAAKSLTLTTTPTAVSVDVGSTWSVTPNPLSGSTSSQRWYSSQTLTGTASATTIVFKFQHQYYLTMTASGPGSVTPSNGWYNSGARVTIKATANSGHKFDSWAGSGAGSYTGTSATHTITMNAAITETATFT